MRVIWSFSTGSPIYSSYQAPINKDRSKKNTSSAPTNGFVECGDDWSLYMHDKILGKMVFVFTYICLKLNIVIVVFMTFVK
jgi:serine/threonine-protein kinase/endoribonuclease IRE1